MWKQHVPNIMYVIRFIEGCLVGLSDRKDGRHSRVVRQPMQTKIPLEHSGVELDDLIG